MTEGHGIGSKVVSDTSLVGKKLGFRAAETWVPVLALTFLNVSEGQASGDDKWIVLPFLGWLGGPERWVNSY